MIGSGTPYASYEAPIEEFLKTLPVTILGHVVEVSGGEQDQIIAWNEEIRLLQAQLHGLHGHIFLEFDIPRVGSRADVVLLVEGIIFVIEFKVGARLFLGADRNQVWDYALDFKNFHAGSRDAPIVPILVATQAPADGWQPTDARSDGIHDPIHCCGDEIRAVVDWGRRQHTATAFDAKVWGNSPYIPTPTIIEAAQRLYANHTVKAIYRQDAGAKNLTETSASIDQLIASARLNRFKAIAFVTGVPGAGKTLVGITVASKTRKESQESDSHAVYLSGNAPLVAVLREALTRDEWTRERALHRKTRKGEIHQKVSLFIQNVHHFRDDGWKRPDQAPHERVVIFDEAQRAWNREMTSSFMRRKKQQPNFDQSEPEFLLSCMDRHQDWAVVICLVGGGQEINRGEAGIGAWIEAIVSKFPDWHVHVSPELKDREYAAGNAISELASHQFVVHDQSLHLAVSMRSFRAENLSNFVKSLLDLDAASAKDSFGKFSGKYPIVVTRDISRAKRWIREHARGTERFGIVASSEAQRLKPHAIDVRVEVDPIHYFLGGRDDTRSSNYLEDAATEFQVQGLELDWACVTWDADFRRVGDRWSHHAFRGDSWVNIKSQERKQYLKNAYRVLLTRARQGMVIFVPQGEPDDQTRCAEFYDETYGYLRSLGIPEVS